MSDQDFKELKDADLNVRGWWSPFARVKRWFIDNRVQRTIAYLVAMTGQGALPLNATEDGSLLVASTGTAIQEHASSETTYNNVWADVINDGNVYLAADVWARWADAEVQLSLDGVNFTSTTITVKCGTHITIDRRFKRLQVKSKSANTNTKFGCIGYRQ